MGNGRRRFNEVGADAPKNFFSFSPGAPNFRFAEIDRYAAFFRKSLAASMVPSLFRVALSFAFAPLSGKDMQRDALLGLPLHWLPVKDILHARHCAIPFSGNSEDYVKRVRFFVCNWNVGTLENENSRQCPADISVCATHVGSGEQKFFCREHGVRCFEWSLDYCCYFRNFSFRFAASP